ncbi:hypothetical protein COEREDRAFT_89467 [Coemansia reversa NRRL 1564]|uniref:Uncharacterized protein n=1 Tax=Coemansia reversa (strain ATCC 12441 / NRRL 1564) TaxID=763665 RepID=A0A2G5B3H0_COERN|nr:hypothetical protein COEREDRAFT_89467 [Coemansia reversa NRRL 1564]|eukprot:PIA13570.1 hypothetical protein COEREDRAFT_89467 [Coemansia reversa NRRL 1564]
MNTLNVPLPYLTPPSTPPPPLQAPSPPATAISEAVSVIVPDRSYTEDYWPISFTFMVDKEEVDFRAPKSMESLELVINTFEGIFKSLFEATSTEDISGFKSFFYPPSFSSFYTDRNCQEPGVDLTTKLDGYTNNLYFEPTTKILIREYLATTQSSNLTSFDDFLDLLKNKLREVHFTVL